MSSLPSSRSSLGEDVAAMIIMQVFENSEPVAPASYSEITADRVGYM